jgi:alkaline phosphatase
VAATEPSGAEGPVPPPEPPPSALPPDAPPPGEGTATLYAVGDIGWCGSPGMAQTAALLDRSRDPIMLLGDLAYPNGTMADFRRCFEPEYGRFRARSRPVPGNHEYDVHGAEAYYTYFGDGAGPGRQGYYAFRAASWHVLVLNSSVPIDRASVQYAWLRDQLRDRTRCAVATVHHPFDGSGNHGQTPWLADVWQLLSDHGVDVMLNGHDHNYERIAPQNALRQRDPARGIRQFTVGTGGAPLYPRARYAANSEVFLESWGVLRLTLRPTTYEWEFLGVNGRQLDSGVAPCH